MSSMTRGLVLGSLALLPLMAACDDSTSADNAMVQVQITDATSDYVQSAEIWVSRVYLQGGPGNTADTTDTTTKGRVDLFNNAAAPFKVDLMVLQNGLTANLTQPVSIPAGDYKNLRIVVDSAKVTLKAPYKFEDGTSTKSLKIPSGNTSGLKVELATAVAAVEGKTTVVLVDVDVNQNFVIQLVPQSANTIRQILFTPRITEKKRTTS